MKRGRYSSEHGFKTCTEKISAKMETDIRPDFFSFFLRILKKKLAKSNAIFKALEKGDLSCFRQIVGKAKKKVELSNLRDRLGRTLLEFIISNHDLGKVSN